MTEDWAIPGGKALNWEIKYVVHFTRPKFPITLWIDGYATNNIDEDFIEDIVMEFVTCDGLTQLTLYDAYREYGRDVSVSRLGREDV